MWFIWDAARHTFLPRLPQNDIIRKLATFFISHSLTFALCLTFCVSLHHRPSSISQSAFPERRLSLSSSSAGRNVRLFRVTLAFTRSRSLLITFLTIRANRLFEPKQRDVNGTRTFRTFVYCRHCSLLKKEKYENSSRSSSCRNESSVESELQKKRRRRGGEIMTAINLS